MAQINYSKPLIKWIGGKTQIIDIVMEHFPRKIKNYHELFLGGGSVLFGLLNTINQKQIIVTGTINAYDINATLINLYKNVQSKPKLVLLELQNIITVYNSINGTTINRKPTNINDGMTSQESYFYWIRKKFNEQSQELKNTPIGSAYFIFLNKTCFRGMYREGPNGYNVPFGHYTNPEIINKDHLMEISKLIKNVNFIHLPFEESMKNINKDDFVYLDPPYAPETSKSFVGYNVNGFNLEQHKLLFLMSKQFNFLMSNADVDLVKNSFKDIDNIEIKVISCKRSINSKKPNSKTNELLIRSNIIIV